MILTITNNPFFNQHKLATRFRNKSSNLVYYLSRYTDKNLVGTLFLHCRNDDDVITEADENDWELAEPIAQDPQLLLTRLLECFHDGDRAEIIDALDDISNHVRQMHTLPIVYKDVADTIRNGVISENEVYVVPPNAEDIYTTATTQNQGTREQGKEATGELSTEGTTSQDSSGE